MRSVNAAPASHLPRFGLAALLITFCALTGCARSVVITTVHSDGSWARNAAFYALKATKDGAVGALPIPIPGVAGVESAFALPAGPEWKVTHESTDTETTYRAQRTLKLNEAVKGDVTVKSILPGNGPLTINTGSVRQLAPGRFEYREVIHWNAAPPKALLKQFEIAPGELRRDLPPALATEANVHEVAALCDREFFHALFGPGDPLMASFSTAVMMPDLFERRIMKHIGGSIMEGLESRFGQRLTRDERLEVTRQLVGSMMDMFVARTKNGTSAFTGATGAMPGDMGAFSLSALTFSARLPGKIVETNGEVDEVAHEVFWALYPEAAALGDVELRAVCDTSRPAGAK